MGKRGIALGLWIDGHYETYIGPSGPALTVWVPGDSRQLCR
jgi:hypothetical protein